MPIDLGFISIDILGFIVSLSFLFVAMTLHEFAHGLVAYACGDHTAKSVGRLTLNPLAHIDLFGTIVLPLTLFITTNGRFVFGAAKPVPIDYRNLRDPKRDMILIGAAGPAANLACAVAAAVLWRFASQVPYADFIFRSLITVNVCLAVFNLIPIPPLDGSRIVAGFLPASLARGYSAIEPYGFFILLALMWFNILDWVIWPAVEALLRVILALYIA